MKKKIQIIYIIVITFMTVAIAVVTFVIDNRSDNENNSSALEDTASSGLVEQMESRISGNFGFRKQLIALDTFLQEKILHTSNVLDVIIGENGNLFFAKTSDDYQGIVTMSQRQQYNTVRTLELMQQSIEKDNGKFRFVIAPNKNSLYDEMPFNYQKYSDKGNADIVMPQLSDVDTVDLFQTFYNEPEQMYFRQDTHWNSKGALLAYDTIMAGLKQEHPDFDGCDFTSRRDFTGDLEKMLRPEDPSKDLEYYLDYDFGYHYLTKTRSVEQSYIESENPDGTGSLYMFRDSFGNALLPYFAETYYHAVFDKSSNYNLLLKQKYNADTVVLEIAERNLPLISQSRPVFYAPECKPDQTQLVDVPESAVSGEENKEGTDKEIKEVSQESYTGFAGILDADWISEMKDIEEAHILIRLKDRFYEMTPQTIEENDYGFCAYFPEGTDLTDYEIYIEPMLK